MWFLVSPDVLCGRVFEVYADRMGVDLGSVQVSSCCCIRKCLLTTWSITDLDAAFAAGPVMGAFMHDAGIGGFGILASAECRRADLMVPLTDGSTAANVSVHGGRKSGWLCLALVTCLFHTRVPATQFVHNNARVFGYNSPGSLQLRDQDRIVVAPHNAELPLPDLPDTGAAPMEE